MHAKKATPKNILGTNKKVFVGISGGVDSAVSAALLQHQGWEVTGVFIRITLPGYPCSAGMDVIEAMRVAAHLDIPFVEVDLSKEYAEDVFRASLGEYEKGHTPNPDALCNREIKFGKFFEFARARGADYIATGHYVRTKNGQLFTGVDESKDQSYFLWSVPGEALAHALFPVGDLHKSQVRALAQKFSLPNAARKDSQGLCFLGDIAIEDMLARELAPTPGNVLNESDSVIGRHDGTILYTLGQRHGFTLFAHTPKTLPHFVVGKDLPNNTITVSTERYPKGVKRTTVSLRECNWIGALDMLDTNKVQARFRYRQILIPASVDFAKEEVTLQQPHYVPEGQSLVLYDRERCLGGGVVDKSMLA